jgi:hypothetical protein
MTVYEAVQDTDAEDPRTWGTLAPLTVFLAPYTSNPETDDNAAIAAFLRAYGLTQNEDQAVTIANRWSRVFGNGDQVQTFHLTGYAQGDWWHIVTTGDQSDADVFEMWARGDVWQVTEYEETTCNLGDTHRTLVDSTSGIYAADEASAIDYYQRG